jgi:hypothetical protein
VWVSSIKETITSEVHNRSKAAGEEEILESEMIVMIIMEEELRLVDRTKDFTGNDEG